jgi:hypothetical protein
MAKSPYAYFDIALEDAGWFASAVELAKLNLPDMVSSIFPSLLAGRSNAKTPDEH